MGWNQSISFAPKLSLHVLALFKKKKKKKESLDGHADHLNVVHLLRSLSAI